MNSIVFSYSLLVNRMEEKGVSKSQLSKEIGISDKAFEKILSDGLPFKMKQIQNICNRLQIHSMEIGRYFFHTKFDQNIQKTTINPADGHCQTPSDKDRKRESKG